MKNIIIYATKYGCTEQAAELLKRELPGETALLNIMTGYVPALENYDTVILGGSVYIGRIQKQLTDYIQKHLDELLVKNIGLYLCAGASDDAAKQKELESVFPKALSEHAKAIEILGYAYYFEKMKFFDKTIMKKIKGDANSETVFYQEKISHFVQSLK